MRSYTTSRTILSFFEFCAWTTVVVGILVAAIGYTSGSYVAGLARGPSGFSGILAALPGLGISFVGVVGVIFVQLTRANVDTAEMTGQLLEIARKQLTAAEGALQAQGAVHNPPARRTPDSHLSAAQPASAQQQKSRSPDAAEPTISAPPERATASQNVPRDTQVELGSDDLKRGAQRETSSNRPTAAMIAKPAAVTAKVEPVFAPVVRPPQSIAEAEPAKRSPRPSDLQKNKDDLMVDLDELFTEDDMASFKVGTSDDLKHGSKA